FQSTNDLRVPDQVHLELIAICERHGLKLRDRNRLLTGDEFEKAVENYTIGLLAERLRARDGHRLTAMEIRSLGDEFFKAYGEESNSAKSEALMKRFAARHGGVGAAQAQLVNLAHRVFGLYTMRFFSPIRMTMIVTLPGEIVETNGQIVGSGRVRWRFEGKDVYPFGYEMRCRSFVPDARALALPGAAVLANRESMIWFADLVGDDERVQGALKQCRDQASFKPLLQLRKSL